MGQQQTIGTHKTIVTTYGGTTVVQYHQTKVVHFSENKIWLDSGGHKTNTTKSRMNQTSNQYGLGYQVYQKNFQWFVDFRGCTLDFTDGMVLNRDN